MAQTAGPGAGPGTTGGALARDVLGVPGIVFLVLAAVAPLTGIVVVAAIGIAVGNGGGMVGAFLIVTLALVLFAVGYAQMSKELVNTGGFYAFVVRGLGRRAGLVTGFVALLGYNCFVAGAIGTSGFFFSIVVADVVGLSVPWPLWSLVTVAAVFLLSRRGLDVSAKVLAVSLVLEISILVVLDVSVLVQQGYSSDVFSPSLVFSGSVGLAFLFAANCFIGFEATALFSEEARDPRRTIPRATYVAIVFIGVFAAVTTWAVVSAVGVAQAQQVGLEKLATGDLVFTVSQQYLGTTLTKVMMLLLLVSLFAALLALHNSATRYIFALGRVGILPKALGRTSPASGAPKNAAAAQLGFAVAVAFVYWVAGLDPITALTASMTGFGTLGILVLQLLAAVAIVVHFRRTRDPRLVSTLVAPGLGALALAGIVTLAIVNFPDLAGSEEPVIGALPWLLVLAVVAGLIAASWLRSSRPQVWANLSADLERFEPSGTTRESVER